ncbi:plasmid partition protein ParG [Gordonia sihwensis]|uniref:plasmid partition protein ParG n=1 Tax=Gordonia sihwensis TaxID=173559 RepID=UPI003D993007
MTIKPPPALNSSMMPPTSAASPVSDSEAAARVSAPRKASDTFSTVSANAKKFTIRLDPDLHEQFKIATIQKRTTITAVIESLVRQWTQENS